MPNRGSLIKDAFVLHSGKCRTHVPQPNQFMQPKRMMLPSFLSSFDFFFSVAQIPTFSFLFFFGSLILYFQRYLSLTTTAAQKITRSKPMKSTLHAEKAFALKIVYFCLSPLTPCFFHFPSSKRKYELHLTLNVVLYCTSQNVSVCCIKKGYKMNYCYWKSLCRNKTV